MGGCFSSRFKTERKSPSHNGLYSKIDGREGDTMIGLRSNATFSWDLKCFTLKELKTATGNLVPDSQGWIDDAALAPGKAGYGFTVAVKKINEGSRQEHGVWLRKINYMGQLSHPNLLKLIGYCLEDFYPILVYEFLDKGSLHKCLFERGSNFQPLSWKMRMKIALDAAKGLAFLHSDEVNVIHGDFRTSHILIDSNHNAKLSDFGLDKYDAPHNRRRVMSIYAAADYFSTGYETKKGDVYSFGVVLLELMSGKRAFDINRRPCEFSLVEWAKQRKIFEVMDPDIEGQYSLREARKVSHIAFQCLSDRENRQNIDQVVRALELLQD